MLALGFLLLLAFAPPSSNDGPALTVEIDGCLAVDEPTLRETIELRLGAGVDHRGASGAATRVLLDCGVGATVELTLIDPISDATMTRTVELPPAQVRAERLAVQAVGLVRAAWTTVELEPPAGPQTRAERVARRIARRPATPWELGDGFVVRSYFGAGAPSLMLGEQVEVVHRPLRHLAWKADGELAFWRVPAEADGTTGEVATLAISAAPALLGWGEIPSKRRRAAGTVAIYGGAGFRAGGVRMRGDFGDTGGFRAFAGPLAVARLSVSLGRFVGLAVNAEAGWLLHGPERPQGIPLSLTGPWVNGVVVIVSRF